MQTIQDVYASRCYRDGDRLIPHFWTPKPFVASPFTLFGDDRSPVREEWGVGETLSLIIGLQLCLELPVGDFVNSARLGGDLPSGEVWRLLLQSNAKDEVGHQGGFEYAAAVYPVAENHQLICEVVGDRWIEIQKRYHPLLAPMVLEVGVFLVLLGVLRIVGGRSLMNLAARVAVDEARHTTTNVSGLLALGIDPYNIPKELDDLRRDTLELVVANLDVPEEKLGDRLNKDFLIRASDELIQQGIAPDFDDLAFVADRSLPFEISNEETYSRSYA